MHNLINLLPRWRGWEKQEEEARVIALFVAPESKMQEDGLYPERYTLAEIRQKLEAYLGKKVRTLELIWWLASPHKVSYWQRYRFRRLSGSGDDAVFGINSWDDML